MAGKKKIAQLWDVGASTELPERGRLVVDVGEFTVGVFQQTPSWRCAKSR